MDKQTALQLLGLNENASGQDIQTAMSAKKQDVADKKSNAPTEALKVKFEALEAKLAEAEKTLTGDIGTPIASPLPQPSLSQTKLADLPGMAPQDAAQVELQPGQILAGRYEIKELIGQGGMGAVYRAFDKNTDRDIALKLLLPSLLKNDSARQRFLSEAKISQQLSHPNIVNVFDVQSEDDLFFLTMELLEGQDLRQWLDNLKAVGQQTPIDEVKRIVGELCDALSYAHEFTVHRDIKPENIWLDPNGKVKLMDFGIARVQSASQRTQTGAAMGTAYYMAPEQLQGRELDARADIYAVGVMLYEMLTGQIPAGRFESAITLRKEVGKGLNNTIDKALSVNPEQRFANTEELKTALQTGKAGKVSKVKSANPGNTHFSSGPNKLAIAAMMLLLVGGIGVAAQQGWLDALKPLDRELIAQQKAEATKLLGQVKALQKRLDNSLRDLDRDVSEAKREGGQRYTSLQTWQNNAEDYITRSSTLTDLLGDLALGEGYLRDDETAGNAVTTLSGVKEGYENLLGCFDDLEGFEKQQVKLEKLQTQWQSYGIGGSVWGAVTAMEQQIVVAENTGQPCENVKLIRKAVTGYEALSQRVAPLLAADKKAQQAKSDWQVYALSYNFTGQSPSADQAQKNYDEAEKNLRSGELDVSLPFYQKASENWSNAKQDAVVVAAVKEQKAAWAAEAKAEIQRKLELQKQRKAEAAAAAKARQRALVAKYAGKLVNIPGGSFRMGSNNGERYEKPVHSVNVSSFSMQEHEVTWNQYQPCIDAGVCSSGGDRGWGKGNRPVIKVSWNDIQTYIKWLNQKTGQRFRLPSEAEWEYAARAGSTGKYSWGDSIGSGRANYGGQWNDSKTTPVKSFSPNRFGLYDMHGNVWEFVQDCWHDSYNGAPSNGSAWTSGGDCSQRVLRGGSWYSEPNHLGSASRGTTFASFRDSTHGFRLAQDR